MAKFTHSLYSNCQIAVSRLLHVQASISISERKEYRNGKNNVGSSQSRQH